MKISAVIPAYNSQEHIARAIDSVLAQTRPADEIIVVDDGSTDKTADVVRGYGDKVILIQQENGGVSVARNTGIETATGDWIAFLDADDEWLENKLELQCELLERNPQLCWVCSGFFVKTGVPSGLKLAFNSEVNDDLKSQSGAVKTFYDSFAVEFSPWTSVVIVKRSVFDLVGMFKPGMKKAQDTDLWLRISYEIPQIGYIAKPLAVYHMDTVGSSMKINSHVSLFDDLIEHQLILAKEKDLELVVNKYISRMVQHDMRLNLREGRLDDVRYLNKKYFTYLPANFKREFQLRLGVPVIGNCLMDFWSWVKSHVFRR